MAGRPRLYLDVDGTLCPAAPDPEWGAVRDERVAIGPLGFRSRFVWAPALVDAIGELQRDFDLEIVWLTAHCDHNVVVDYIVPALGGPYSGRVLPYEDEDGSGLWKAEALLHDQAERPGPFLWADDTEVPAHGQLALNQTAGTPSLLLAPTSFRGLTVTDLVRCRQFLDRCRAQGV